MSCSDVTADGESRWDGEKSVIGVSEVSSTVEGGDGSVIHATENRERRRN